MFSTFIPIGEAISPTWLTAVLRANGILPSGEVAAFAVEQSAAFNSATSFLRLTYFGDVPDSAPRAIVCKRNISTDWGKEAGAEEVRFYRIIAQHPAHPPIIIPCYAANYDATSGDSYILLRDLSATHAPPLTRAQQLNSNSAVPSDTNIARVIDTLAALHAYWWEQPTMSEVGFEIGYWSRDVGRFAAYLAKRTRSWQALSTAEFEWFPADYRALYEHLLARLPQYWETHLRERFVARRQISLVHNDAYFANFLTPYDGTSGQTYLLDWQSPGFDVPGNDLANLLATFWTPEQRRADAREAQALARYLEALHGCGVVDYTEADLRRDYQHGLIDWVLIPVQDRFDGSDRAYWWPKMQNLVAAFREWDCTALLAGG